MKKVLTYVVPLIVLGTIIYMFTGSNEEKETFLFADVEEGDFLVEVVATGELKAKNSIKIRGPQGMRNAGIWNTTIKDLVPEGTNVKKGQFVASLDKTELATRITDIQTEIEKFYTQLEQAQIDTAIQMKDVRDQIANLQFSMAQEELEIEKNKYEPQMVIEQSELRLKNSQRNLAQLENKTDLLRIQSMAKVREIETNIKQQKNKLRQLMDLSEEFTIKAPEDGMVIYETERSGKKGPGSQISGWNPVVAELPDLTVMNSIAYVNEVDISKIKKGQLVGVMVDAFPEKSFNGRITSVANIGQQLRNQEAKVFEIVIEIQEKDEVLRPAMTTSNTIKIYEYKNVVNIPLEGFLSDSLDYVIKRSGGKLIRQEVASGPTNANNIIILHGVEKGDQICISPVEDLDLLDWVPLADELKDSARKKIALWKSEKETYDKSNAAQIKEEELETRDYSSNNRTFRFG
jgi:multidrug efflux pump subunit AcrA (membrane-fusion protein)